MVTFGTDVWSKELQPVRIHTAVHDFPNDTNLFLILLAGVGVICINDAGRMNNIHFLVHVVKTNQVFVVIILGGITML